MINIIYNNKKDRLDIPIKDFMNNTYRFLDYHVAKTGNIETTRSEILKFIDDFVKDYASKASTEQIIILNSPDTLKRMNDIMYNVFKCLVDISRPGKNGICKLEKNEILWKTKEEHESEMLDSITYSIEDFFGLDEVVTQEIEM